MQQTIIDNLEKILRDYSNRLSALSEEAWHLRSQPDKWSKKQIMGHLVDSAQNNVRRFIVAQYEEVPTIVYNQDKWVAISDYENYPAKDLVTLWMLLNRHMARILSNTSEEAAQRKSDTCGPETYTIEWLAADYCHHLLHHLHQILNLDPIAYP
jgi:hypothetical protein